MAFIERQLQVCQQFSASFAPPIDGSRLGIALHTLANQPLNGLRMLPEGDVCGWYLWGGEFSDDDGFFVPLCVQHVYDYVPLAAPYLALPPGWRFLTDGSWSDVWFDANLLSA